MGFRINLTHEVTNRDIAFEMTSSYASDQADILREMALDIAEWKNGFSWAMQCRNITEALGDDPNRKAIAAMLRELLEHIEVWPEEQAEKARGE